MYVIDIKIYEAAHVAEFPFEVQTPKMFYRQTQDGAEFIPGYYQLYSVADEATIEAMYDWARGKGWIRILGVNTVDDPDVFSMTRLALEQGQILPEDAVRISQETNILRARKLLSEIVKRRKKDELQKNKMAAQAAEPEQPGPEK